METEESKHETEESLAHYCTSHNIKLQNGDPSSDRDFPPITGGTNWISSPAHYVPSIDLKSMKRRRENTLTSEQRLFDQGSYKMNGDLMNGEFNHILTEQSSLVSQPKKRKVDLEIKGNGERLAERTKVSEFECSSPQTEINLEKRNCHYTNGDFFSLPRNKQVPNGALYSSSSKESTPGDLIEKTLSQYYPEQVSVAPQTLGSQMDSVNDSLASQLSSEGAKPPVLTSGLPTSTQPNSQHHSDADGNNRYNSAGCVVNGHSGNFEGEHQQQRPSSYSGREPGMIPPTSIANGSQQHSNGASGLPDNIYSRGMYMKAQQKFEGNMKGANPLQAAEGSGFGSFPNAGVQETEQNEKGESEQILHHGTDGNPQFGIQMQKFQDNIDTHHRVNSTGHVGPGLHHLELENGIESTQRQRTNVQFSAPSQRSWIGQNHLHSQKQPASGLLSQDQERDMWRGFPAKPEPNQQTTDTQVQEQIPEPNPVQRFPTHGLFMDSTQSSFQQKQQECSSAQMKCAPSQHNTAPEWQQSNSKPTQMQQPFPQNLQEQNPLQQSQQTANRYHSQIESEHLETDLEHMLSTGFATTQQQQQQQQHCHLQRPLSHPPQFEGKQLKSHNYRPHSQPPPGQHHPQPNQSLRNPSAQFNNQDIQTNDHATHMYNTTNEMEQSLQHQKQYSGNSGNSNLKTIPSQQPNNHCHEPNQMDFPMSSAQSQLHSPEGPVNQQVTRQMYPKVEQQLKNSCTQFQRGPRLPLGPAGPHVDFQRHAALRMHLLQRQERQDSLHSPHSFGDPKQALRAVKIKNEPRFELPASRHQEQRMQPNIDEVQIKQENQQIPCDQNQGNILASMEQSLRQYQLSPVFEKKSIVINSSNKVKVESSGPVTILSTNTVMGGVESANFSSTVPMKKSLDSTPKKEPLLQRFIDSPVKLLDTPIRNLLDTPLKTQYDIASCHCVEQIIEKDEGPYYTHLGSGPSVPAIREMMEKRSGLNGHAIRIEKVIYTGKEGKSTQGCPIAKWVIRRSTVEEKLLVLVRERTGHRCDTACIIVVILVWEGIQPSLADHLYLQLSETLTKHGAHTQRRCAFNEERTCACQGFNPDASGASFSFGCSWSMYYNGCKFARSKIPRKFKLQGDDVREEEKIEQNFQHLATLLGPLYKTMAPEAYGNQVEHEHRAPDCRLGNKDGRPFSGVTACMDFCAHAHRDLHNMQGGSTVVCTLTREDNREIGKIPEDEQLHVLPLYKASTTDEFGSEEGQQEKIKSGALQVLSAFRRQVRMLAEPAKSCRQKKLDAKKNKNAMLESSAEKAEKANQAKSKNGTYESAIQNIPLAGPIPGALGATLQPGHPQGVHSQQLQQRQHQGLLPPYPGTASAAFSRFPNHPGPFPSTSKPGSMYPSQPPTPASPYPPPLHVPNTYMNGSNRPYPGYQCNGGMPLDNYQPHYSPDQKHLDVYRQQQPALYPEQQHGPHQRYQVNYSPRYSDPGLVNNYSAIRSSQAMRPYGAPGPTRTADAQFIDPHVRAPSAHGGMDYTPAVNKGNQFGEYPNRFLPQNPSILSQSHDPFHMQIKSEMGLPSTQMLPVQIGGGCLNSETGFGLPNGAFINSHIKQEPGTPQTPTTPQKPEMWSDNEHNFLDPDIGGVAVAPTHGSVLIECAKRELHATTPLKNPDRNHPTRISLVFYQHKNLNEAKHGLALWEAKMAEKAREKEEEAERNGGEGTPSKGSKKGTKREHSEISETTGEPPYKRFIKALMEGSLSHTTNTYVSTTPYAFTKVTGPYSQFK